MRAKCTIDDLERLLEAVRGLGDETLALDQLARCESFLVTSIDTRLAQQRARPTAHHQQLMEAYRTAAAKWELDRENFSNGFPAEQAAFEARCPRPTLQAFMRQHRQVHRDADLVCPVCGAALTVSEAA